MFPQLIAGPIVVYKDIAKQIRKRKVSLSDPQRMILQKRKWHFLNPV